MSEFKFACPICGQHITADSQSTGSQLECPTCFRKIVVPQAPASPDPKFILSASEANKPRPPHPSLPALEPFAGTPARPTIPQVAVIILIAMCLASAATMVVFRKKFFGNNKTAETVMTNAPADSTSETPAASEPVVPKAVTNDVAWNLDLSQAVFPDATPAGKLRGEFVSCNRHTLTGGALGIRQTGRRINIAIQVIQSHIGGSKIEAGWLSLF